MKYNHLIHFLYRVILVSEWSIENLSGRKIENWKNKNKVIFELSLATKQEPTTINLKVFLWSSQKPPDQVDICSLVKAGNQQIENCYQKDFLWAYFFHSLCSGHLPFQSARSPTISCSFVGPRIGCTLEGTLRFCKSLEWLAECKNNFIR